MPETPGRSQADERNNRRLTRNNGPLGTSVLPKRAKDHELDDQGDIRVNPFLVPLEEIPREVILDGKPGAVWHFSAVLRGEPDNPDVLRWRVMLGSEELLTVMSRMDFLKVLGGLRKGALEEQKANPEEEIAYPTQEGLAKNISGLGHTTIAVDFKIHGATKAGKAALSGEFRYDPACNAGWINDKSGRYMSKRVRTKKTDRDPEKIAEWGQAVAKEFSDHLGIPVPFNQLKTSSNPVATPAAALQPTAARPSSSAVTARPAKRPRDPATDTARNATEEAVANTANTANTAKRKHR
ncbi:hypothetical protein [Streptomyces axinellae]|uniref:Uncharacterized protein n=1 Tax=Streptomyces axinellae TaxID=552788 RepID=A0ABP6D311_9ACTN